MRTSRLAAAPARPNRVAILVPKAAAEVKQAPLLQRLGGPDAIKAAVDIFYGKVRSHMRTAAAGGGTARLMPCSPPAVELLQPTT